MGGATAEIASAATNVIKDNLPSGDFGQFTFNETTENALNKGIKAYIDAGGDISEAAVTLTVILPMGL